MFLTAMNMKMAEFWDGTPCILVEVDRYFRNSLTMQAVTNVMTPKPECSTPRSQEPATGP
jgi:hypothetical protein